MEAEELRIGNLYIDTCGAISTWSENSFNHYKLAKVPLSELKPIPLTEDWLLRFGASSIGDSFVMHHHGDKFSGLIKITYSDILKTWDISIGKIQLTYLDYVHSLQNLYFALTQNELEIK